ncbi:MAG: pseudouridine synthase [Succinivibrionaceae bacterium]
MAELKRLDKFLTECFEVSRSAVGKVIRAGKVTVNGEMIKDAATKLAIGDMVNFNDIEVKVYQHLYFMVNKPENCVCANDDSLYPIIFSYLETAWGSRSCHCVGRLDLDTTGLVLITNDGQWSHRITSPKRHLGKTYLVDLADDITEEACGLLTSPLLLKGEEKPVTPGEVKILSSRRIALTIYEGKYHQVKRMVSAAGNEVIALHRQSIGQLQLDPDLAPGEYRELTPEEIALF